MLYDYLLSTVNSIYELDERYLFKAIPIHSVLDIPAEENKNYLLLVPRINNGRCYIDDDLLEISPASAYVNIYHNRNLSASGNFP